MIDEAGFAVAINPPRPPRPSQRADLVQPGEREVGSSEGVGVGNWSKGPPEGAGDAWRLST